MRIGRVPSSCLLVLALLASPGAAHGRIVIEGFLPDPAEARQLRWGLRCDGREVARGSIELRGRRPAEVPGDARSPADPAKPDLRVEVSTDGWTAGPGASCTAYLCLGDGPFESYIPAFGDRHQERAVNWDADGGRGRVRFEAEAWREHRPTSPDAVLTVRYHRFDGDYDDASLWTWDEHLRRAPDHNELLPVGRDDFGVVFQIDTGRYGQPGNRIGLLPRLRADWDLKDGPDRFWSSSLGREVYILQDHGEVYMTRPDVNPRLVLASIDAPHGITARFSHRLPVEAWPAERFRLVAGDDVPVTIKAVHPIRPREGQAARYWLETADEIAPRPDHYALEADGHGTQTLRLRRILHHSEAFHAPDVELGAIYNPSATTFRVFAPSAAAARVVVADELTGDAGRVEHAMERQDKGIWEITVTGDLEGKHYAWLLSGTGFEPDREIRDIYATCTQGRHARSLIVDLRKTDPPGFREHDFRHPDSPVDAVIYEMHVRDFTIARNSGVKLKGKYLGLTESGTHLPAASEVSTGLDHLVELGVTHVQLMPIQDFDNFEDREDYNWGYMPASFNSPDGWYATSVTGPARIAEFKQAVQAFHERGIGVILDVVYNHTSDQATFEDLVPGYYFRMTDAGRFHNGSGCGNEFHSENPIARKFILDSIRFWLDEYRVDGFRFDLMGLIDLETMKQVRRIVEEVRPGALVYGEPWVADHTPLKPITDHDQVRGTGIGAFNDRFRDAIKGGLDDESPGFIQAGEHVGRLVEGLHGAVHDWTHDPTETINYFEAHDNLTAWDKLRISAPDASIAMRRRMMRLAALSLLTAQGVPFIHSGQEFCRSKQGHANSYDQPDEINQLDWSLKRRNADVYAYHRGLIALRKAHPAFRLRTREEAEQRVHFGEPPHRRAVVYQLDAAGVEGETAEAILVLLNGSARGVDFPLVEGSWSIVVDADHAGTDVLATAEGQVRVPQHSGMVLLRFAH